MDRKKKQIGAGFTTTDGFEDSSGSWSMGKTMTALACLVLTALLISTFAMTIWLVARERDEPGPVVPSIGPCPLGIDLYGRSANIDTDAVVIEAMQIMFAGFEEINAAFNTDGFVTGALIESLGFFDSKSTVVFWGPFFECHSGHSIIDDPYYPHDGVEDAPKTFHSFPEADHYVSPWTGDVWIYNTESFHYCGQGIPSNQECPVIAEILVVGVRKIVCDGDGNLLVPVGVDVGGTVNYYDCGE